MTPKQSQAQETRHLIRRARLILSAFLVLIGALLVYVSTTMKADRQDRGNQHTAQIEQLPIVQQDDVLVQIKDKNLNIRGQGVLVSTDGIVLTNKHVVEGVEEDTVVTYKGNDYVIDYIGLHAYDDYALVRIYEIETACVTVDTNTPGNGTELTSTQGTVIVVDTPSLTSGIFESQIDIKNGMSGTPLFTDAGLVSGLLQARDELTGTMGHFLLLPDNIDAWIDKKATQRSCGRMSRQK